MMKGEEWTKKVASSNAPKRETGWAFCAQRKTSPRGEHCGGVLLITVSFKDAVKKTNDVEPRNPCNIEHQTRARQPLARITVLDDRDPQANDCRNEQKRPRTPLALASLDPPPQEAAPCAHGGPPLASSTEATPSAS